MKTKPRSALTPVELFLVVLGCVAGWSNVDGQIPPARLLHPSYDATGAFRCELAAAPGTVCEVQVSSDLVLWRPIAQITIRLSPQPFEDPAAINHDPRFYRVLGPITERSPDIVDIFPPSASPGMTIRITTEGPAFTARGPNTVWINGTAVPALWIGSKTNADVLLPPLRAGSAVAQMRLTGQLPSGRSPFEILPARTRLVVLSLEKDTLRVLGHYPCGDQPSPPPSSDERRLSFDVLNGEGGLVASCAVPHPLLPVEVFDEAGKGQPGFRRIPAPSTSVLAVKLPAVQGLMKIRCYDTEPGTNLTSERDRKTRHFLNELELTVK